MNSAGPIVVGFDGSDVAGRAVTWAAHAAEAQGAQLLVVNAADRMRYIPDASVGFWTPDLAQEAATKVAERGVELAREVAPDVEVTQNVSLSSPALTLEELSADARQIVVGNTGHGRIAGILLGSTAFHVATHAQCPVTVIPSGPCPQPGPEHRVSVASDGSPSATRAVKHAANIAGRRNAPLEILTVWEFPYFGGQGMPVGGYMSMEQAAEKSTEWATKFAEDAKREALQEQPGLTVTTQVLEGRPQDVLADASADAAMLVVGARGRGDLRSLLLGSTSRALLHHAKCAVEIVR
ncbi:MAG TPA: universal stress protein [Ornithinicoccus sp.]|nr:universal stress protein [Ornithinicoccus sp.]